MNTPLRSIRSDEDRAFQRMLRDSATTLAQIKDLSPQSIALCYRFGYQAYQAGDYDRALRFFSFLAQFDHVEAKHWFGLGATLQKLRRFDAAALAFSMAALISGGNPTALLHAADCRLSAGERSEVPVLLKQVVALSDLQPEADAVRARAQGLLELLNRDA